MNVEELKTRYQKIWAEYQSLDSVIAEKLFLKHVRAIERVEKAKRKLLTVSERERKREARALIILAKLIISERQDVVKQILSHHISDFLNKEGAVLVDYSKYIYRLLETPSETETSATKETSSSETTSETALESVTS